MTNDPSDPMPGAMRAGLVPVSGTASPQLLTATLRGLCPTSLRHVASERTTERYLLKPFSSEERDRLFAERRNTRRRILQAGVTQATPLLRILERQELADALEALGDPLPDEGGFARRLDWVSAWRSPSRTFRRRIKNCPGFYGLRPSYAFTRLLRNGGVMARGFGDARGLVGLRVIDGVVETVVLNGDVIIITWGGTARVELPFEIAATLESAMVGRRLDEVVGGPMFDGRDYVIRDVRVAKGVSLITARTRNMAFSMPWPDMV